MASKISDRQAKECEAYGTAVEASMGEMVEEHQKMILRYYNDVRNQANRSFWVAVVATLIGFAVLILSLRESSGLLDPGLLSGLLIEFIAAIAFWLYARGAKQFGAFHVCLERTHRYLLAYKIANDAGAEKESALHELACIMANAPMISHEGRDDQRPALAAVREVVAAS